jgi:hypothetical protein
LNDQWHHTFANQARAQDVSNVLNPAYKPSTPAKNDFQEKQKYLYAVLESKAEMAKGKAIICKYESDLDALKVYKELTEHHLNSPKAALTSTKI